MIASLDTQKKLKTRAGAIYAASLALLFFGILFNAVLQPQPPGPIQARGYTFMFYVTASRVVWIWATCVFARSKGYSPLLGALGLLWIFGPILIALLPDRYEAGSTSQPAEPDSQPTPRTAPKSPTWEVKPMPGSAFED